MLALLVESTPVAPLKPAIPNWDDRVPPAAGPVGILRGAYWPDRAGKQQERGAARRGLDHAETGSTMAGQVGSERAKSSRARTA
jgi:hypothetical protein